MQATSTTNGRTHLALGEIFSFAYETFMSNKVRFAPSAPRSLHPVESLRYE
jgi:hypothetical protein